MVTAELAACLPVLVLVLGAALSAVSVVAAHVRLQDAAREAARAAARGDLPAARRLAGLVAPGGRLAVSSTGPDTVAVVHASIRPLGPLLPAFDVTERAVAATEVGTSAVPGGGP